MVEEPASTPDADDITRFVDRRRPWLRPETPREQRRRRASIYWAVVYVLLVAGVNSVVSFVIVRGYLFAFPSPTTSGADVAARVVPWVVTVFFVALAAYVTRSWRRTLVYSALLLSPYVVVLFLRQATDAATWIVGWLPGGARVYGLAALLPFLAFVLLGRDFVRWQLWVEFPEDACWECGAVVADDTWVLCPWCGNDLQVQRAASTELEAAQSAAAASDAAKAAGSDAADDRRTRADRAKSARTKTTGGDDADDADDAESAARPRRRRDA